MNGEFGLSEKKGNNVGCDYNIPHFLIFVLTCLVSFLLSTFLKRVFIVKENYEKLPSVL